MQIQTAQGGPNTTQTGTDPVWYDFTAAYASAGERKEGLEQKPASDTHKSQRTEQKGVVLNGQTELGIIDGLFYTMANFFDH